MKAKNTKNNIPPCKNAKKNICFLCVIIISNQKTTGIFNNSSYLDSKKYFILLPLVSVAGLFSVLPGPLFCRFSGQSMPGYAARAGLKIYCASKNVLCFLTVLCI